MGNNTSKSKKTQPAAKKTPKNDNVSVKQAKLSDLIPDDKNFNRGTQFGQHLIEKSLRENGAGRSILIDKNNRIIAGNKTTENAAAIDMEDVIVVETDGTKLVAVKRTDIDLDSEQGRNLAMADNATSAANLEWDEDTIRAMQDELDNFNPEDWGVTFPEESEDEEEKQAKEDDFDEEKDHIEVKCKRGDIWQLGDHRLMCGDSTNAGSVTLLMDGAKAPLTFTDPPYRLTTAGGGVLKTAKSMKQIRQNGVNEFNPLELKLYSETNIYTHNKSLIKEYILLAERENKPYDLAIYKKQGLPNYKGHLMTDIEYIAIIGNQNPKQGLAFDQYSKVFVGNKDKENDLSYSKPVALCAKFINLYSSKGDIILDLFGGSGTTLIAAEQLNRKCYMMELDPHYCDVIIARWEKLTGGKAKKINLT